MNAVKLGLQKGGLKKAINGSYVLTRIIQI